MEAPATPALRPGDVIVGTDAQFVIPASVDEVIDIPDTAFEAPQASQPAPVVTARKPGDGGISGAWSWLMWLGGAGLALILGLLMFGRHFRNRFGSVAVGAPVMPSRRREDSPAVQPVVSDVDFDFDEGTLNSRSITLDVDLDAGTGFPDGSEMDVAQDFGFSATATDASDNVLDLELTADASREEEPPPTEVIPPSARPEETILDSEVLPSDEEVTQDYDVSMMIDATKHILEDNDASAKDLQAVHVDADDDAGADEHTVDKKIDYTVLEQDYQDEFTATQALNQDIEKAARELAERMEDIEITGVTAEMPTSQNPENTAELTASLPTSDDAENEDFDDTGINPAVTTTLPTAGGEITIEMESGRIDTKKSKAS